MVATWRRLEHGLTASVMVFSAISCGGDLTITHEQALQGQYRSVHLGDEAADVHARFAETGAALGSTVIRQDLSSREVLDQLAMEPIAELRDVTETSTIQALFVERPTGAPDTAQLVIATTSRAQTIYDSGDTTVFDAVLTASGVAIAEGSPTRCTMRWLSSSGEEEGAIPLEDGICTETLRLAPGRPGPAVGFTNGSQSGVAYPDSALSWDGGGDLITWDPLSNAIVVAWKGETEIRSWLDDGTEAWYTDIGQAVEDLDSMGVGGAIALATTVGKNGRLVLLDSVTGVAITAIDVPVAGIELSAGSAGTHLALTLPDELHLFSVDFTGAR